MKPKLKLCANWTCPKRSNDGLCSGGMLLPHLCVNDKKDFRIVEENIETLKAALAAKDKELAAQKEIIMELLDAFYVTVQKGDIAATKALAYAVKQGWIKKEQVIR